MNAMVKWIISPFSNLFERKTRVCGLWRSAMIKKFPVFWLAFFLRCIFCCLRRLIGIWTDFFLSIAPLFPIWRKNPFYTKEFSFNCTTCAISEPWSFLPNWFDGKSNGGKFCSKVSLARTLVVTTAGGYQMELYNKGLTSKFFLKIFRTQNFKKSIYLKGLKY